MAHLRAGGTLFPYELELNNGQLQIRSLLGGADTPLNGASIISINGEAIDKVTSTLLTLACSSSTSAQTAMVTTPHGWTA
ncbi:hypothetical protein CSQ96_11400 [Janthinobacterium sp. BJB412]|nr:hypothetical protein CSQ96_11400 [Janthinobacterium sp. BJB412]